MVKIPEATTLMGRIVKVLGVVLILFGLYVAFQIVRKIVGGSWETEEVILALLMLNLGTTITLSFIVAELKSDHNHLKQQFGSLAADFKSLAADFKSYLEQGKEKG